MSARTRPPAGPARGGRLFRFDIQEQPELRPVPAPPARVRHTEALLAQRGAQTPQGEPAQAGLDLIGLQLERAALEAAYRDAAACIDKAIGTAEDTS